MKNLMKLLCCAFLLVIALGITGCGGNNAKTAQQEKSNTTVEQPPAKKEMQQIEINIAVGSLENGKVPVDVTTNIIDGAELMIHMGNQFIWREEHGIEENAQLNEEQVKQIRAETYSGSTKKIVQNGKIHCEFSGDKLAPGTYDITVSMSIPSLQKDKKVAELYGRSGEYLADGPCVKSNISKHISKTVRIELQ